MYIMGFYSDLMGFYSDLIGFYSDLMGFYSDLIDFFVVIQWDVLWLFNIYPLVISQFAIEHGP